MYVNSEMKQYIFLAVIAAICLAGCRSPEPIYNAVGIHDDANSITLRCNGYGKTEADAISDAGQYAVEQLLFRGVPNSNQRNPLIGTDESTAKEQYETYLNDLFNNKRYLSFLTLTLPINSGKERGRYWTVADITINLRALRMDLEQAGVIRKFGL